MTRKRPFELTYIQYDQIKYDIASMECVEYSTDVGRHFMNVVDI